MANDHLHLSPAGGRFIRSFEALVLTAYQDPGPRRTWTIGWGNTDPAWAFAGNTITREQAEVLFRRDVVWAEQAVRELMTRDLAQHEFDALVSLVFNIGRAAFSSSTARRRINSGDIEGGMAAIRWFRLSGGQVLPGLVRRREWETRLFLGDADPSTPEFDPRPELQPDAAAAREPLDMQGAGIRVDRPSQETASRSPEGAASAGTAAAAVGAGTADRLGVLSSIASATGVPEWAVGAAVVALIVLPALGALVWRWRREQRA